jgi:hypothetical protein
MRALASVVGIISRGWREFVRGIDGVKIASASSLVRGDRIVERARVIGRRAKLSKSARARFGGGAQVRCALSAVLRATLHSQLRNRGLAPLATVMI